MASTRLTSLALANLRRTTLTVDATGKLVKEVQAETAGKTITATTTTTTATGTATSGVSKLIVTGDTSSTTLTSNQTNLSIVGGRSIKTAVQGSQLIISLNDAVSFSQAVINSPSAVSPLIIRNSNNQIVFSINPQGVPILEPKTVLPGAVSGMVYISGSNVIPEGFYLGFPTPADSTAQEANKTDLTGS